MDRRDGEKIVRCPKCGHAHHIKIENKGYDRKAQITCRNCKFNFKISITENKEICNLNSLSNIGIENTIIEGENLKPQALMKNYQCFKEFLEKLISEQDKCAHMSKSLDDLQKKEQEIRDAMGGFSYFGGIVMIFCVCVGLYLGGIFGLVVLGIIGVIFCCFMIEIDTKMHGKERIQKADIFHNTHVVPKQMELEQQKKVIDLFWNSDIMSLYEKMIPEEYRDIEALEFFIHALEIKRAASEDTVFNLYEEELHRRKVEAMQRQQLANSEKIIQTQNEQLNMQKQQIEETKSQSDIAKKQLKEMEKISKKQRKISRQVRYGNIVSTLDMLKK